MIKETEVKILNLIALKIEVGIDMEIDMLVVAIVLALWELDLQILKAYYMIERLELRRLMVKK